MKINYVKQKNNGHIRTGIVKNYIFNLAYQIILIIIPLVTMPYIARVLGAKGIGQYSYTYSIVTYFCLFGAQGTVTYAQREIGAVQSDEQKRSCFFWNIFIIRLLASTIAILCYIFLVAFSQDKLLMLIQGLYLIGVVTDVSWYFQGLEEFAKVVPRNMIMKLVSVAAIFLFVKNPSDVYRYAFALAFFPVLGNLWLWQFLPKYVNKVHINKIKPLDYFKGISELFIPTVAIQIYTVLDKTMIGMFTEEKTENGYYENGIGMVKLCVVLITSLGTVMVPRISNVYSNGDTRKLLCYMRKTYGYIWRASLPICIGLIFVSPKFIPVFLGEGFDAVVKIVQVCSVLVIAIGLSNVTGIQYLIATNKQNIFTITVIIGALCNLILNLILIPKFFALGAGIASIVAEIIITTIQMYYVLHIECFIKPIDIFGKIWKPIISTAVMASVLYLSANYLENSMIEIVAYILLGVITYAISLVIMRDEVFCEALHFLIVMIKKGI